MKNLSQDIELAINDSIIGMTTDIDILSVDDDKLDSLMKSRLDSFSAIKEMLVLWENSNNSPSHTKLRSYIEKLIKAGDKSIDVLRDALRKNIDYEKLDVEKYGRAIKAKPVIFRAINEINSGLLELRLQLESDKIDLKSREFKRGYPEKFANQEFFPIKDYYKEWYNEEEDAIMICPKGTKGEIIVLDNLRIQLPKPPKNKKDILFSKFPKEEQYWRRQEPPKGLSPETEDQYADYIIEEFRKRREGVWFMNNGEPVWITPAHYMGLQWNQMLDTGGYKDFRMAQCRMYYFTLACIVDPRCVGEIFAKGRRSGFTEEIIDFLVNDSTSIKNALMGITSKTGTDAQEAFLKYSYGIQNLPFFFRPVVKGKVDDRNKMEFGKPSDNTRAAKKSKDTSTDDYLNTKVDWMNTTTLAYDSKKLVRYLGDECLAKGTKILCEGYVFKNIEEIKEGDKVIVEGDKLIEVAKTFNGVDDMYKVSIPYGKDYYVNSRHRIYFERRNAKKDSENGFKTMTPTEYLNRKPYDIRTSYRVYSNGFNFKEQELPIDPYILGLWLGDGSYSNASFTVNTIDDPEIVDYLKNYAERNNFNLSKYNKEGKADAYSLTNKDKKIGNQYLGRSNDFIKKLESLNLLKNKHIPEIYLKSSRKQRLELLAGLIDSDGHLSGKSYSFSFALKHLTEEIQFLCRSLGLDVSNVTEKTTNFNTLTYRLNVQKSSEIPCILPRKKSEDGISYKSRRIKMEVSYYGKGEYFGIQLKADNDNDRRLILEDFTLTMNCGKWERPNNYVDHWSNVKPTMLQGGNVVGKAFLGSTLNPRDKGGEEFITLFYGSDVTKRNSNGRTSTGLYSFFLPAHKNYEDYTDKYGVCHESVKPGEFFYNSKGVKKTIGALQYLENEFKSAKLMGAKAYNNARRLDPITIEDAFRDEMASQLFDIEKINAQLKYNRDNDIKDKLVRGNFYWKDGVKDTEVVWKPEERGRFLIAWIPPVEMRNKYENRRIFNSLTKCPVNNLEGAFGCDPYDQTGVVDSKLIATENGIEHNLGSKGSLHGVTATNIGNVPSNFFFLEYLARPETADMFFEDVLMACVFYSMPILIENNKKMLLKHFKTRGYRGFCLNRFDKEMNRLSPDEKELGGIPNNSADIINMHWTAIEKYVHDYVGEYSVQDGEQPIREIGDIGNMYFDRTLADWMKFDVKNRTKFDASISSGLALLAVNRHRFKPQQEKKVYNFKIKTY